MSLGEIVANDFRAASIFKQAVSIFVVAVKRDWKVLRNVLLNVPKTYIVSNS